MTDNKRAFPSLRGHLLAAFALGVAIGTTTALGAEPAVPLVVPVDGETFPGELVSIAADGSATFRLVADANSPDEVAEREVTANQLVRWGHPPLPRRQMFVLASDGSRMMTAADWSGGVAVQLEGDSLIVRSDVWNDLPLPRSSVRGLVFAERRHPEDRQRLVDLLRAADGNQDQVWLTNEDRLSGTISLLSGGSLTLATDAGEAHVPLSRVEAVVFGSTATEGSSGARSQPYRARLAVGLRDGSLLYATNVHGDEGHLTIELAGGETLRGGVIGDVASLQTLGGPLVYLSDLEPADYRHVPYLDIPWTYHPDRNVLDQPLSAGGNRYLKGLGMHSAGRITYTWDDAYRRLDATVAIDDAAGPRGSVTLAVYVFRDRLWREAYRSDVIRGGQPPQQLSIDLAGTQGVTLTVDYADRGDELDYADWLDARLVKE